MKYNELSPRQLVEEAARSPFDEFISKAKVEFTQQIADAFIRNMFHYDYGDRTFKFIRALELSPQAFTGSTLVCTPRTLPIAYSREFPGVIYDRAQLCANISCNDVRSTEYIALVKFFKLTPKEADLQYKLTNMLVTATVSEMKSALDNTGFTPADLDAKQLLISTLTQIGHGSSDIIVMCNISEEEYIPILNDYFHRRSGTIINCLSQLGKPLSILNWSDIMDNLILSYSVDTISKILISIKEEIPKPALKKFIKRCVDVYDYGVAYKYADMI